MKQATDPPRDVVDAHTLIAQRYAGYFVGHPYRAEQQGHTIIIDRKRAWKEPAVVVDSCEFCVLLTDEEAVRRVAGFQWQLDIEVVRSKSRHYATWSQENDLKDMDFLHASAEHLRAFIEQAQDVVRPLRPNGWNTRPLPMFKLPLRLKRKLCIEWNHVLRDWMIRDNLSYDFAQHVFWREVPDEELNQEDYAGPEW